ncbi:hypothetical protein [Haloglomus halophilum]|uniref:hypothetical protein n=1 Tax=Haloglomus halophilum TaxID=2962672 RepID=UPI0020C9639F|nr:hypothetical protein [Haloglomus halophilum]
MEPARVRDGVLAGGCLASLLYVLGPDGRQRLRDPGAALAGIGCALALEWAFIRYPEQLLSLWERPAVNRGSALALLGGGLLARGAPRVLAAACWGLVTYFGLLVVLIVRRSSR